MATLEEMLMEGRDEVACYLASDEFNTSEDDVIVADEALLKQYAELWRTNEASLRMLIRVMKTGTVRYLIEKAKPVETVGIRHELQAVEAILARLAKYSAEYERFTKAKTENQTEEVLDNESPPAPPPVEEGKEGSL